METGINEERRNLLFGVQRSVRYHTRRRMFFDSLYKWTQVLALISGSATVAVVTSQYAAHSVTVWLAAAVAISSAMNLVFGFAGSARLHSDFAQKFSDLEKRIILDDHPTRESVKAFTVERLGIETAEPPILRVLDMICHNELCRAMGYGTEAMAAISMPQRLCAQFFDLMDHKIQAPKTC